MRAWLLGVCLLLQPVLVSAAPSLEEQVLVGEAANQGYDGMYAVGCVLRNRGWRLDGFSAAKRADLYAFYLRQPAQVQRWATEIVARLHHDGIDTTGGATHYENVTAFGTPRWAQGQTPVKVLGSHTFWKLER